MKKEVIFIILLLIPAVIAAENDLLYDESVYSGQEVNVSNEIFTFAVSSYEDKVSVSPKKNPGFMLDNGSCQTSGNLEVCFKGREFWYKNYTLDKEFYKAIIEIYQLSEETGSIEFTRTVEEDELLTEEETRIESIIENTGSKEITDIIYEDSIPPAFLIKDLSGGLVYTTEKNKTIKWNGNLSEGKQKKIYYKIKALNKTEFESKASLSYDDGNESFKIYSDPVKITVSGYQLETNISLGNKNIEVTEETDLNITLKNLNTEEEIRTEIYLTIPYGLKATSYRYFDKGTTKYSWIGTLEKEGSRTFSLVLNGNNIGNHTVNIETFFTINNIRKKTEDNININVYSNELYVDYRIEKKDDKANIIIELKNPSEIFTFDDIDILIRSTLPALEIIEKKLDRILPLESQTIASVYVPLPETKKEYSMISKLKSQTNYNNIITSQEEKIITLLGSKETAPVQETEATEIEEITDVPLEIEEIEPITGKKKEKMKISDTALYTAIIIISFIILLGITILYIKKEMTKI